MKLQYTNLAAGLDLAVEDDDTVHNLEPTPFTGTVSIGQDGSVNVLDHDGYYVVGGPEYAYHVTAVRAQSGSLDLVLAQLDDAEEDDYIDPTKASLEVIIEDNTQVVTFSNVADSWIATVPGAQGKLVTLRGSLNGKKLSAQFVPANVDLYEAAF